MKRVGIALLGLVAVLAAAFLLLPRQQRMAVDAATFDVFLRQTLDEAALPGIAVVVIRDGAIVHASGYGFADVAARRAMTPDTPMNIASVSKPILGMGLLRLREEGRLDLDKDVNGYLPFAVRNPRFPDKAISVRMLVSHTSSIADFYDSNDFTKGADAPGPLNAYLADLLSASGAHYDKGAHYLETAPGAAREYSNLAAGVAGAVAEAVAGESLASFQRRTLFAPLGMTHTSWIIADYGPGELATRYDVRQCAPWTSLCANTEQPEWNEILARVFDTPRRFKTFEAYPQLGNPNYPDGGVNASANDLAILMQTLLNDGVRGETRVLSPENFNEMFRLQAEGIDARQRFFWRDRDGLTGHAGSDIGVFSYFYFDRAKRNGYIVLINRSPDAGTERTMGAIATRIGAEFFKP